MSDTITQQLIDEIQAKDDEIIRLNAIITEKDDQILALNETISTKESQVRDVLDQQEKYRQMLIEANKARK